MSTVNTIRDQVNEQYIPILYNLGNHTHSLLHTHTHTSNCSCCNNAWPTHQAELYIWWSNVIFSGTVITSIIVTFTHNSHSLQT